MSWIQSWYVNHFQKTLASVLGALAVVDMTPYEQDFKDLLPWPHWHAVLRLSGAIAIFWRAVQK
jgi:hypothetical protein